MFEKIKKEDWLKLTKEEQDYYTLKFRDSQEKTHKLFLYVTRGIAILCILSLFYIGYTQMKVVTSDTAIREQYGSLGYCYLCGLETFRTCSCQYHEFYDATNTYKPINLTEVALKTANKNIEPCPAKDWQGRSLIDFNISKSIGNLVIANFTDKI